MTRLHRIAITALVLLLGCGSAYDGVDIYAIGGDYDAIATPRGVGVAEGGVVVIEAQPIAESGHAEYNGLERFELRIADTRIARVRRGVLKDSWVINGLAVGDTKLQVRVDGELEELIPVRVGAQP